MGAALARVDALRLDAGVGAVGQQGHELALLTARFGQLRRRDRGPEAAGATEVLHGPVDEGVGPSNGVSHGPFPAPSQTPCAARTVSCPISPRNDVFTRETKVSRASGEDVQGQVRVQVLQLHEEQFAVGGPAGVDALDAVRDVVPVDLNCCANFPVPLGRLVRFQGPALLRAAYRAYWKVWSTKQKDTS